MSLLMDALKKAELAKRQGQGEVAGDSTGGGSQEGLSLEPMPGSSSAVESVAAIPAPGNAPSAGNLPHLPSHLETLDDQFLAEAQQAAAARLSLRSPPLAAEPAAAAKAQPHTTAAAEPRRAQSKNGAGQNQSAAQNVFAAKQSDKPPARKVFALAMGVLTVLAVCGIGGYFWWQLQPKTALVASRAPLPMPPAVASVAASTPAAVSPAPTLAAATGDKDDDSAPLVAKAPAQTRRTTATAPTEAESPIRVTRAPLEVNPALMRGFDAFNRGDLAVAQSEYERAQKSDPRNTDALHGLAAIAVRQGRVDQAEWLYRKIAEADPHDTVAMSALINMRGQIDPGAAESRLKSLSADQPELAAPHFSLGNLYARHGRWNEAQQAYFRAYSAEPDNPDILYNLAISLEHLRQNKLAAQYYSQAIAAAQTRPAGFDKTQAAARLRTLQP